MTLRHLLLASLAALFAASCTALPMSNGRDEPVGPDRAKSQQVYTAEILRLPYGVPRIVAKDHAGLGYGTGYAAAEDNLCLIMERALTVRGERSAFFGPGDGDRNVASDLYHRRVVDDGVVEALLAGPVEDVDTPSRKARAFMAGFAAGVNRVVAEAGTEDPACAGEPWVRPLSEKDIWLGLLSMPFGQPIEAIALAEPPGDAGALSQSRARVEDLLAERRSLGSNAYAIGAEATRGEARSVLLGNPHYPWDGALRFYRLGMTIPGELNAVGAGLVTLPFVVIGHTGRLAWTHTVSTARRVGFFELDLDPTDPARYRVGDTYRDMQTREVTIEVLNPDGERVPETRTLYETEFGPVVVTERLPWTRERAFAIAAPSPRLRALDQYLAIYAADSVEALHAALGRYQATSFNTVAVDAQGRAYYGDIGLVPRADVALVARCAVSDVARGFWNQRRIPVLNAADPTCRWGLSEGATADHVFAASEAPHLFRDDYVVQSNDSPWLTNPESPITGLSPIWGDEATARSLRTRLALDQVAQRLNGSDGLGPAGFDLRGVQQIMYANRHLGGELLRDDLVETCRESGEAELQPVCEALAGWDLRVNLDSTGAHAMALYLLAGGAVFEDAFDAENAVYSPISLDRDHPAVLRALRAAASQLAELKVAADAPLGEVQGEMRGERRIPIHGGPARTGVFNMINPDEPVPGRGWISIPHGSSWIMTVEFNPDGPVSEGVLTYSQSTDPTSAHFGDQTELFSAKGWDDLYFDLEDARAAALEAQVIAEK